MAASTSRHSISTEDLLGAIQQHIPDCLLTPAQAATFLSVSPKWLADAREGLKGIAGPRYVKLGPGRTASIRYRASDLREFIAALPSQLNTADAPRFANHDDFMSRAQPEDEWLYALDARRCEAAEFFSAVQIGMLTPAVQLRWIRHRDAVAGRLFTARNVQLTPDALHRLRELGAGDVGRGIAALLEKGGLD